MGKACWAQNQNNKKRIWQPDSNESTEHTKPLQKVCRNWTADKDERRLVSFHFRGNAETTLMASKGILPDQESIHQKVFYSSTIKLAKVCTEVFLFPSLPRNIRTQQPLSV